MTAVVMVLSETTVWDLLLQTGLIMGSRVAYKTIVLFYSVNQFRIQPVEDVNNMSIRKVACYPYRPCRLYETRS
jgi:hypothetical protein